MKRRTVARIIPPFLLGAQLMWLVILNDWTRINPLTSPSNDQLRANHATNVTSAVWGVILLFLLARYLRSKKERLGWSIAGAVGLLVLTLILTVVLIYFMTLASLNASPWYF